LRFSTHHSAIPTAFSPGPPAIGSHSHSARARTVYLTKSPRTLLTRVRPTAPRIIQSGAGLSTGRLKFFPRIGSGRLGSDAGTGGCALLKEPLASTRYFISARVACQPQIFRKFSGNSFSLRLPLASPRPSFPHVEPRRRRKPPGTTATVRPGRRGRRITAAPLKRQVSASAGVTAGPTGRPRSALSPPRGASGTGTGPPRRSSPGPRSGRGRSPPPPPRPGAGGGSPQGTGTGRGRPSDRNP